MARYFEPTDEQVEGYREWVASRPEHVRVVAERFAPWELYRMKSTGQRVIMQSLGEHDDDSVTLTVLVSADYNFTMFERSVFGVKPDDLEPCELPDPDELTGAVLSPEQVEANLPTLRKMAGIEVKH